jgi:hypothetical protein
MAVQVNAYRRVSMAAAVVAAVVSMAVLVGWATNIDVLTHLVPGGARMVPATALAFFVCSVSVGLLAGTQEGKAGKIIAYICACGALFLGLVRVISYLGGGTSLDFLGLVPLGLRWEECRLQRHATLWFSVRHFC